LKRKLVLSLIVVVALAAVAAGIALAGASGDDDKPITGSNLDRATAAALEHTGGGTVTETEIGDDGAAYGVEIRLPDGTQVEVDLDGDFNVIGQEGDDDGSGDEDEADD
jgi:uncharacterized membrane protein YkoI